MSAEIASIEKVRAAVAQLHLNGQRATADAVIAAIGGGSKPTVLKHLKTLRSELQAKVDDVPAAVIDLIRPVVAQLYAEGGRAEAARMRDQVERLHRLLGDMEAELEDLGVSNASQDRRIAEMDKELARSVKALSAAEVQLGAKDRKIDKLMAQLAERDTEAQVRLSDVMKNFDEKLTDLTKRLVNVSDETT